MIGRDVADHGHVRSFRHGAESFSVGTAGQPKFRANVGLHTVEDGGVATSTTSVIAVENVIGGNAGDSLAGSSSVNLLFGGSGADWIVGGPGNDMMGRGSISIV